jgi:hypothetical protein
MTLMSVIRSLVLVMFSMVTGGTPLTKALINRDNGALLKLLRHPFLDPNRPVLYPTVGTFTSARPDVSGDDQPIYPLWLAVFSGNLEGAKLLLRHPSIDVTARSWNCGVHSDGYDSTPKELAKALHSKQDFVLIFSLFECWHQLKVLLLAKEDEESTLTTLFSVEPALITKICILVVEANE